jgi:tagatose-1,6-bisphosphate aldolase
MGLALSEIKQKGWYALVKELGYAGATKFMLLYEQGDGDYVKNKRDILKDITLEKIKDDILKNK